MNLSMGKVVFHLSEMFFLPFSLKSRQENDWRAISRGAALDRICNWIKPRDAGAKIQRGILPFPDALESPVVENPSSGKFWGSAGRAQDLPCGSEGLGMNPEVPDVPCPLPSRVPVPLTPHKTTFPGFLSLFHLSSRSGLAEGTGKFLGGGFPKSVPMSGTPQSPGAGTAAPVATPKQQPLAL